ncbi:AAA family ATPase, partial [Frankia sp. AgPm24]|uniref:helix-turn-helix transcriptional regulator n=1 Tax=Frankia sp. AgPm24 TaxID=631128 RepID=UPI00200D8923
MRGFIDDHLVERQDQLECLTAQLQECVRGSGGMIHLVGPVASGKTALVRSLEEQAREAGVTVLRATGSRAERLLPLGVIAQLLDGAGLAPDELAAAQELMDEGSRAAWAGLGVNEVDAGSAYVLRGLCVQLLARVEKGPVVITVDDAHLADAASLQCLSYLGRRLPSVPMLVLLAESPHILPLCPAHYAELAGPHVRTLQVGPLSVAGTGQLMARFALPSWLGAEEVHARTGGSPLLLHALLRAQTQEPPATAGLFGSEDAFGEAVLGLLYRSEPLMARGARALAVLGASDGTALLANLLEVDPQIAGRVVTLLRAAGLLGPDGFRDPRTPAVILANMSPSERAELHAEAARRMHCGGAPSVRVARHLVGAGPMDEPWVHQALVEAAGDALAAGDHDEAIDCLRTARARQIGADERAVATALLVRVLWRTRPIDAARHLPTLVDAARAGHLGGRHAVVVANQMLWHGDGDGAIELITAVCARDTLDQEVARGAVITLLAQAYLYPGRAGDAEVLLAQLAREHGAGNGRLPTTSSDIIAAMGTVSSHGDAVAAVERVLAVHGPGYEAVGTLSLVLATMIFADRLAAGGSWRDPLAGTPMGAFAALLSAMRAESHQARGELADAERCARDALAALQAPGWGVLVGVVVAIGVRCASANNRFDAAEEFLAIPVPTAATDTICGLDQLHARGAYYLARGRARAAVSDFLTCRDRSLAWHPANSGDAPWRTDLAWALLLLGRHQQAQQLAEQELRRLGTGQSALRVPALRLLAASSGPDRRLRLLREAVDIGESGGCGPLELAHAYTDLSEELRAVGETSRARVVARVAAHLARQLGVEPLLTRLSADDRQGEPRTTADLEPVAPVLVGTTSLLGAEVDASGLLSDAERRVALLAGLGHTNREIARRLHVTISTVEQHLTRVYRKLQVSRRTDLAARLGADAVTALGSPTASRPGPGMVRAAGAGHPASRRHGSERDRLGEALWRGGGGGGPPRPPPRGGPGGGGA